MALSDYGIEAKDDWATILAGIIPPKVHLASHEHDGADPTIGVVPYVCVVDEKVANTGGGEFELGGWRRRDLNTEYADTKNIATVGGDIVVLPAGTYRCHASAPAFMVDRHKAVLYDWTGGATLLVGSSEYAAAADNVQNRSVIAGVFTISEASSLGIQHRSAATRAGNGFGVESNFAVVEVYTIVEFWKIG